jgi:hypothetical protein
MIRCPLACASILGMLGNLTAIWAKIQRASDQTELLKQEIDRHPKPIEVMPYRKPDPEGDASVTCCGHGGRY